MNRPRVLIILVAVVLLAVAFSAGVVVGTANPPTSNVSSALNQLHPAPTQNDIKTFQQVWATIHSTYVNKNIDDHSLMQGALRGLVNGLGDPYSVYFSPTDSQSFEDQVEGVFQGVGMEVGVKNNHLTVIAPLPDSPAAKAGILSGDWLTKINDTDTASLNVEEAVDLIRGKVGTTVKLSVRRDAEKTDRVFSLTRANIKVQSVVATTKAVGTKKIGIITISSFTKDTGSLTEQAVRNFLTQPVSGIVLDLRNNPGGYLDQAVSVTSVFVPSGVVVEQVDRDGHERNLSVSGQVLWATKPLVVLVNGGSASASEIVAGALQDHHRASIIGETTFGKGTVQDFEELADGSSIKLTVAKWLTPNGRSISEQGISPDQKVTLSTDDADHGRDPQLDAALKSVTTP